MTNPSTSPLEQALKRDRLIVAVSLFILVGLAWLYLISLAASMDMSGSMQMSSMMQPHPWSASDWIFMFFMWAIMMVGMMLPSAAPTILLYTGLIRRRTKAESGPEGSPSVLALIFLSGYMLVWTGFSAGATWLHWLLEQSSLVSPMMVSASSMLNGVILIGAGIYQWLPIKDTCLSHCRSPVDFVSQHWRTGASGALKMGLEHGLYCLGCCWVLMALLFVGGVMSLLWIALIAGIVFIEKIVPRGDLIGRWGGVCLVTTGLAILIF